MQSREYPKTAIIWCLASSLLGATAGLAGCRATPPVPASPPPHHAGQPVPLAAERQATIDHIETLAGSAFAADRLLVPEGESAFDLYSRMLALDPGNDVARRGLEQIVERFLELAEQAAEQRRFAAARSMLSRARLVDRQHPSIPAVERQVELLRTADHTRLDLPRQALADRDSGLADQLGRLGARVRSDRCRSTIYTARDSDARWVYEQMRRGPGDGRVVAGFEVGLPPRVELLCFQP